MDKSVDTKNFKLDEHCSILDNLGDNGWFILLISFAKEKTIPYLSAYSPNSTVSIRFSREYNSEELKLLTKNSHISQKYQYIENNNFPHQYNLIFPCSYDLYDYDEDDDNNNYDDEDDN